MSPSAAVTRLGPPRSMARTARCPTCHVCPLETASGRLRSVAGHGGDGRQLRCPRGSSRTIRHSRQCEGFPQSAGARRTRPRPWPPCHPPRPDAGHRSAPARPPRRSLDRPCPALAGRHRAGVEPDMLRATGPVGRAIHSARRGPAARPPPHRRPRPAFRPRAGVHAGQTACAVDKRYRPRPSASWIQDRVVSA